MTQLFFKFIKAVVSYTTLRITAMKEFWKFVDNPRGKLKNTITRSEYPEILRHPMYGNHNTIRLPGLTMHYVESGQKSEELLLFVHGFPDFWFSWKHQLMEFSKDYWVVALDMRGYGDTEKLRKVSQYKMDFLVNDIRNLVLALGRETFTLIAHDWGGVVAHYFIRIYPQMLNKYILMNTVFHPKLGGTLFSDVKQFLKSWYILMLQIPYYAEYFFLRNDLKNIEALYEGILPPEEIEIYKFMFGNYDKIRGPINYYRANFKEWKTSGIPNAESLNKTNVSGLYIHGEDDLALTLKMAFTKSFEDVCKVQLACVPHAGHFVHIHSPREVNKIIRNFLKCNTRPPSTDTS